MTNNEMENLIEDVSFIVHDLTKKAYAKIDEYLKEFGLVRSHAAILRLLKINNELPMSELSEKIQVTKPNVTLLIDKLEKRGYVERVNASHDRRIIFIKLSNAGDEFVESYVKKLHGYFTTMFSKLSSEDLGAFKSNISSLKELLSKLEEE